jgi:hypothetical protein
MSKKIKTLLLLTALLGNFMLAVAQPLTFNIDIQGCIPPGMNISLPQYITGGIGGGTFTGPGINGTNFVAPSFGSYILCYTEGVETACDTVIVGVNCPFIEVNNQTCCPTLDGGSGFTSYIWSTGAVTQTIEVCQVGTYHLQVSDAQGNFFSDSVVISSIGNHIDSIDFIFTNPTACGACDGTIVVTANGGTPPYSYTWSNGMTGNPIQGVCAGTYNVYVSDQNGCTVTEAITLSDPNAPTLVLDSLININCLDNNSGGSIYVHAEGGAGGNTWQVFYSLNLFTELPPPYTNLDEDFYVINVTDMNGCIGIAEYNITNTSNLYVATTSTDANCGDNGTASVIAQGLNPPYTYLWNDPQSQTTSTAVNLAPGLYSVEVTDAIGCSRIGAAYVDSICLNVIRGTVYLDTNQNCIQDIGENGIANVAVHSSPGNYYASTDNNGNYTLHTPQLNNTVNVSFNNYTPTCPSPASLTVNFSQQGDTADANDFGFYYDPNQFDLGIHPGWTSANPGFNKQYWIYYQNNSPIPMDAVLRFAYDPALTYLNCTQGGVHNQSQSTIEWNLQNIPANFWWSGNAAPIINFNVPSTVSITDSLCSYFEILPIVGDIYPADNTLSICEPVTGCHDPNAKSVIPDGDILQSDTLLFYTIHFQNDGNDTAFTVVIKDTLSQYLNPATLVAGAASHPYTYTLTGQGLLTFRFDQIMLPDSNINEPESHGYINFTIQLKQDLPIGTVIENTAGIYFDFNEPVITNTTVNTIVEPDAIQENWQHHISIYPNPANNKITIETPTAQGIYQLQDLTGKQLLSGIVTATKFSLDISALSSGIYIISIFDGERQVNRKVVKE